jgi:hypothetical protein
VRPSEAESTVTTDHDRQAAEELRVTLANLTGFWHQPGDDGPLCQALTRYREECERRLLDKLLPWTGSDNGSTDLAAGGATDRPGTKSVGTSTFSEIKPHVTAKVPAIVSAVRAIEA